MVEVIHVLLVDDETGFTSTLGKRLSRRGLDVQTACGGAEALSCLGRDPVDVMVLDMKMPGMSGLQTLQAAKKVYPDVQVILLTGHADVNSAMDAMTSGAFDFLVKPANTELLFSRIKEAAKADIRKIPISQVS